MSSTNSLNVTVLLNRWHNQGDQKSLDLLITTLYKELHKLAASQLNNDHKATIQCTELVSEAYVKLIDTKNIDFKNRNHFFSIAAKTMRRVLIERFRKRESQKRGSGRTLLTYEDNQNSANSQGLDLEQLNQSLELLETLDSRQAEIVTLKFFGGLKSEEIAQLLSISASTVKREWAMARTWLYKQIKIN